MFRYNDPEAPPFVEFKDRWQPWAVARDMDGNWVVIDLESEEEVLLVTIDLPDEDCWEIAYAVAIGYNNIPFEAQGCAYFKEMYETEAGIHAAELSFKEDEIAALKAEIAELKGE